MSKNPNAPVMEAPLQGKRKPYAAPTVVMLGRLDDLTLGVALSKKDSVTGNKN